MSNPLSTNQRDTLQALCDTYVPCFQVANDPTGYWARRSSDLGVDGVLADDLANRLPEGLARALLGLLDALAARGFPGASQAQREKLLEETARSSPEAARGLVFFQKQTLLLTYGLPETPGADPTAVTYGSPEGQNPNWSVLGYPGPVTVPPSRSKQIQTLVPEGDQQTIEADVCVVGSGAGGAVIASRMAALGKRVVVLEMGGYYSASDFHQLEIWSYKHLWYRGGATPTANGTVNLLAGSTLGGGTEVNWMNCIRTPDLVRNDWARNYGLDGVDTPAFDRHLDVVESRLSVNSETAHFNDANLRMRQGCQKLGYLTKQTRINWDPVKFNPLLAGYTGVGDQTGGKQTARRTFLLDAYHDGARIIVNCRAERILVEQGRAAGVEATYSDRQGRRAKLIVRSPQVVVACGSIESPALLLRSRIGGQAVGKYFRVQPGGAVYGVYAEKQRSWWGSPMTANCEQFTDTGDGFGFYMEIPAFAPGFYASVIPWGSGRQHKEVMTKVPYISTFIWFLRDKGYGQVTVDSSGEAVPTYELRDETDQKNFRHATAEAFRIHAAAGAKEIFFSVRDRAIGWKRGQDLEQFIRNVVKRQPLLLGAQPIISAHQLCTCRMGNDPAASVADVTGELHDVKGVWVGDGSACPTSLGANPMITIMALAQRADRMCESGPSGYSMSKGMPPRRSQPPTPASKNVGPPEPNLVGSLATMLTGPAQAFREMAGMMANPAQLFTMGGWMLAELGLADGPGRGIAAPRDGATWDASAMTDRPRPADSVSSSPWSRPAAPFPESTPADRARAAFSHIIELTVRLGMADALVRAIFDQAIPQIIRPSKGFLDEIVLVSETDPGHVTAISFWDSKEAAERFSASGFAQVSEMLLPYLSAPPQRREFVVGASTLNSVP